MIPAAVELDWWRNFKPLVPETLSIKGKVGTEIAIDLRPYLLQGARDADGDSPTAEVLDKVPVQRGWRLMPLLLNQPEYGTCRLSDDKLSLLYVPSSNFIGSDCFNFRLTNGTQSSDVCQVQVEVEDYYRVWFDIYSVSQDDFVFRARTKFPANEKKPYTYGFVWYYTRPVAVWNEVRQAYEIFEQESIVQQSQIWYDGLTSSLNPLVLRRDRLAMSCPTDNNLRGFDGTSNRLYQPKGTRGSIRLEMRVYLDTFWYYVLENRSYLRVDLDKYTQLYAESRPLWWNSVQPISAEK